MSTWKREAPVELNNTVKIGQALTCNSTVGIDGALTCAAGTTHTVTNATKFNSNYDVKTGWDRYFLEDFFAQMPGISANIDQAYTVEVARALNKNFEILGASGTSALATFDHDYSGMTMTTATTDDDQMICLPHLDAKQSAWGVAGQFDSQKEVEWSAAITTGGTITTYSIWAGLKKTNTSTYTTDTDQIFFISATDDDLGAFTSNGNLHVVHSIANVDYISDLGITLAADTTYVLKIAIASDRTATVYVNGTQYSLTSTNTAGGVDTGAGTTATAALTTNVPLIPYIGVQCHAGSAARALRVHYQKISCVLA